MSENGGWKTKAAAEHYKRVVDFIVPGRTEILETISKLAVEYKKGKIKVLDIGCGHGVPAYD